MRALPLLSRCLPALLACGSALVAVPALAQTVDSTDEAFAASQGGNVPDYVVPVLRLVSSTHVEPTTGLVLSESGLVLVPGGFASSGDEIVVLDGGTDIVGNGRTARIEREFPMDGLQVLSVYGLRRSPAPFADTAPADGDPVRLTAFPPAEQIAEGAPPLDVPTTVTVFGESGNPAISGDAALPNVTGPVLDRCGNVVAFSIANEIQTMDSSPGTRYRWRDTLLGVMGRLAVSPGPSACKAGIAQEEAETEPIDEAPPPAPAETADAAVEDEAPDETTEEDESGGLEQTAEEAPAWEETFDLEVLPPVETAAIDPQAAPVEHVEDETGATWPWLLAAALLIAGGLALHAWRRRVTGVADPAANGPVDPPASVDEERAPLSPADSLLCLEGELASGAPLHLSCEVSRDAINVVIGRGQADLRIDSPAVSRRHATLNGTAEALTLTDLGSSNGTTVNGVPCMEGEILYVEIGDTIVLGDARFTLDLSPAGEASPK